MNFYDYEQEEEFRRAWDAVEIARNVRHSLFTFGDSDLPYYLVMAASGTNELVKLRKGQVNIARPMIITPESHHPEFENFFEENEDDQIIQFLLARSAAFRNLKLANKQEREQFVSDSVEEVVSKLNKQLDAEEEEQVAILTAPQELAGVAVLKYVSERVWASGPDNVQELRERGFLP